MSSKKYWWESTNASNFSCLTAIHPHDLSKRQIWCGIVSWYFWVVIKTAGMVLLAFGTFREHWSYIPKGWLFISEDFDVSLMSSKKYWWESMNIYFHASAFQHWRHWFLHDLLAKRQIMMWHNLSLTTILSLSWKFMYLERLSSYWNMALVTTYFFVSFQVGTDFLEEEITKFEDLVQSVDVAAFNKI